MEGSGGYSYTMYLQFRREESLISLKHKNLKCREIQTVSTHNLTKFQYSKKKKKLNSDNHVVFFLFTVLPSKLIQLHFAFSTKYFGAV